MLSGFAVIAVVLVFLWTRSDIGLLRERLAKLQKEVDGLRAARDPNRVEDRPAGSASAISPETIVTPPRSRPAETVTPVEAPVSALPATASVPPARPTPASRPATSKPAGPRAIEQQFGGRAFVWIGGVALALAGFYLVKYSIDTGLLTESVRVILGVLFGLALLGASIAVRARPAIANGTRIAQALAGAGIADLYGSLFAGTTLYHLFPAWMGFAALAATTATALVLSLRHGAPIAALGLIGGYATPALVQSGEPNAPLLFGYLFLLFAGLTGVIRGKNWWWLSLPTSLVAFGWVVLWLVEGGAAHDARWLSIFVLAIGATAAISERRSDDPILAPHTLRRMFAPAGAIVLMALVVWSADFGVFEWAMFALLSAGAIVLGWFDDRTYAFAPWQAMGVNLVMLALWNPETDAALALTLAGFAVLFSGGGQFVLSRARLPLSWAGLSAAATLFYFLLALPRLTEALQDDLRGSTLLTTDIVWGGLAFFGAALMTAAAARPFVTSRETALRHRLQVVFAAVATSLLSLGLAILLHREYLSFALSLEILALGWIATRVDVPALRILAQVLTVLFALSLIPELNRLLADTALPLSALPTTWDLLTGTIFRFVLPAAAVAGASILFRERGDDIYVKVLELGTATLATTALYEFIELAFRGHAGSLTLIVGSIFTNAVMVLAIAVLRLAPILRRYAARWAGMALGVLGVVRVLTLEFGVLNPMIAHQAIGALPLANGLIPLFALPAFWIATMGREIELPGVPVRRGTAIAAYVLLFVWLSLIVRQIFNGTFLDQPHFSDAEIYTYSVVWLAIGIALLFAAAVVKDRTMRIGSLIVMVLVVAKVFLYDASNLTGLWRVVSFLGLGLSLLGLSWFYSRFIFTTEDAKIVES